MRGLTERVRAWQARGESVEFRGYPIHVFRQEGEGPLLLLLHGFPSSSYDWRLLLDELPDHNVLAFDFLGFGLSAKPPSHDYSLFWQADLAEELVRRYGNGRPGRQSVHTTPIRDRDPVPFTDGRGMDRL